MSKISEERLDQMLTSLCKAEPEQPFIYRPQENARPAVVPFYRRFRALSAAAAIVFVSVLSLTAFLLFGNHPVAPIPATPAPHGTAPSEPGAAGTDAPTDGGIRPRSPSEQGGEDAPSPTALPEGGTADRSAPTSPSAFSPMGPTQPTERVTPSAAPAPPTERITPTEQPKPTEKPVYPTDPIAPPWNDPTDGGEPWLDPPTENGGYQEPPPVEFYASFDADQLPADRKIYCKVYDWRGRSLGDRELYSAEHAASIEYISGGTVLVRYLTPEGLIVMDGSYSYVFYDSTGAILAQGQDYVEW